MCVLDLQILPVCANWNDYVWAYFRVMVDVLTEQVRIAEMLGELCRKGEVGAVNFVEI